MYEEDIGDAGSGRSRFQCTMILQPNASPLRDTPPQQRPEFDNSGTKYGSVALSQLAG